MVEEIWRFLFFTWQHNWSVAWLFGWGHLILSQHPAKFWGSRALRMWRQNVFDLPREWCVTWLCGWGTLILSYHSAKFGVHRPCESGDIRFWFVMSPQYRSVTWPRGWGPHFLSHQPAKFEVDRPCKLGDIEFLIFHLTTWSMCHVTLQVRSPRTKSPPC